MKTTPKRNDAFRIRQKSKKPKEKTTLKEKQIHSLNKVKKPKEKTTLTTLKKKQIHLQENDTPRKDSTTLKPDQNRGSEDKKIKASFIREIKLTHSKNGRH